MVIRNVPTFTIVPTIISSLSWKFRRIRPYVFHNVVSRQTDKQTSKQTHTQANVDEYITTVVGRVNICSYFIYSYGVNRAITVCLFFLNTTPRIKTLKLIFLSIQGKLIRVFQNPFFQLSKSRLEAWNQIVWNNFPMISSDKLSSISPFIFHDINFMQCSSCVWTLKPGVYPLNLLVFSLCNNYSLSYFWHHLVSLYWRGQIHQPNSALRYIRDQHKLWWHAQLRP